MPTDLPEENPTDKIAEETHPPADHEAPGRHPTDKDLTNALMPAVEDALTISVRRNPHRIVDVVFPVIGPAIRKSITHALKELVQSFNQTLEYSLSAKSWKWRVEAWRTGKSFAQVVLTHTLLYRVEQVFLIHRETGLMLQQVSAEKGAGQDADLVSAMLTAIQDFVHDSFRTEGDSTLGTVEVGESMVWIEQGPQALLAAVIRGNAPKDLRSVFQDALERIHNDHRDAFDEFSGNPDLFGGSREVLEGCLRMQKGEEKRKSSLWFWMAFAVVLVAVGLWMFVSIRENLRWSQYLNRLNSTPGIIVISNEERGGQFFVSGLRDPLSNDPAALLEGSKIDPSRVKSRWENYRAAYPEFILTRARALLRPPDTVSLQVTDTTLSASGTAAHDWVVDARRLAPVVPGVTRFEDHKLIDLDLRREELQGLKDTIEKIVIHFDLGSSRPLPEEAETLKKAATVIRKLQDRSGSAGLPVRLEIRGQTDRVGSRRANSILKKERASQVYAALSARGIEADSLFTIDLVSAQAVGKQPNESSRTATFRVILPPR